MAEIRDVTPTPPIWPTQPKEPLRDRERRSPQRRRRGAEEGSSQDKEDTDRPHIDEYA